MQINIVVRRQPGSNQWGVYNAPEGETPELIEGGFFDKGAADDCARDVLQSCIEDAERKAGWDPNP